ncbi:Hypothetical protein KP2612_003383 [Komagataella phaffii]|nr:GQ67_03935T0 [Komagataella phaffii]AOA69144.1 GQ68_03909T0 [Komagataella phaffii GS115]CAH2449313.1 Protein required for synthesis of Wybutosine modified tRNA [Komagataella phaffii CBS 7435]
MALINHLILVSALVCYLATGGRISIVCLAAVLYCLLQSSSTQPSTSRSTTSACGHTKSPERTIPSPAKDEASYEILANGAVKLNRTFNKNKQSSTFKRKDDTKQRKKRVPKIFKANKPSSPKFKEGLTATSHSLLDSNFIIFYSSLTGSSAKAATTLHGKLSEIATNKPQLLNMDEDVNDLEDYFVNTPDLKNLVYILVLPSYDTDSPLDYFLESLEETSNDFRIDKFPLKKLAGFTVLGLGDSESWAEKFCYQAKLVDKWLSKLGARRIFPLGTICIKTGGEPKINEWIDIFDETLKDDDPMLTENEPEATIRDSNNDYDDDDADVSDDTLVDVEDMGRMIAKTKEENEIAQVTEKKEMVAKDSPTFKSLTKQGYTVVGSHSGVKICRWTKSALRGRGSCYKFAFYGIRSHLCMETTPSLSCSNKCVFCWRHGSNPVGTTWRWQVDQPEDILNGALEGHYKKIKQMRGVPGIVSDRFNEAFTVRHCALSLVGEPIFYPYINEFLQMLHAKHISSFLVCNAQHPDQLRTLNKVTQLYVSIDASSKDELKRIDRPLFRNYWERLHECLNIIRTVQSHQRTVFRLTLVKGFNMGDFKGYADMVESALPSLIEIKGATFCGSSSGNGNPLTMQNIPFYEECQNFVRSLNDELNSRGLEYGIAAEHAHSCCILIASKRYYINDQWYTHIDYKKFFLLLESGEKFTHMDYLAPTPEWAYWGSSEGGFNPEDVKYNRKEEKEKKRLAREQSKQLEA